MEKILDICTVENTATNDPGLIIMPCSSALIFQIKNLGEQISHGRLSSKNFGLMAIALLEQSLLSQPLTSQGTWSRNDTEEMLDNFIRGWTNQRGLLKIFTLNTQQCLDALELVPRGFRDTVEIYTQRIQSMSEGELHVRLGTMTSDLKVWIRRLTRKLKQIEEEQRLKKRLTKVNRVSKVKKPVHRT